MRQSESRPVHQVAAAPVTKAAATLRAALPTYGRSKKPRKTRRSRLGEESGDFITSDVTTVLKSAD